MAAADPPRQLETNAIATPIHSPTRRSPVWHHPRLWHVARRHRLRNYLAGIHVAATGLHIDPARLAPAPWPVAARSCRAHGDLAAPSQLHGIGPGRAEP